MARGPRPIELRFPTGGLVRRYGYQSQAPYTTPDCENVVPRDVLENRERGGRRPGLAKAIATDFGTRVQCLSEMSVVNSGTVTTYLFGASGGVPFFLKESSGSLAAGGVTITGTVDGTETEIHAVARGQKLFIADGTTNAKVFSFSGASGTVANLTAHRGTAPTSCSLVTRYRDRLVLAGPQNIAYFSRHGDPLDWDYGAPPTAQGEVDAGKATYLSTGDGATGGHPLTALIPYGDQQLLMACENSLWLLRGDPVWEPTFFALSRDVGIIQSKAWCQLPDMSVLFLSRSGLYFIPPMAQGPPQAFSPDFLPDEFLELDTTETLTMAYDPEHDAVLISSTPTSGTGTHWWIDWKSKTFWPIAYGADTTQPTAMLTFGRTLDDTRKVLLGSFDGYLRQFDDTATDDDGDAITGYVVYGPLRGGGSPFMDGCVKEITGTLDSSSADVTWTLRSATHGEDVVNNAKERASGTWTSGRNRTSYPRVRSGSFGVKVSGTGLWSIETIGLLVASAGRQR